jgi:hypothetical protein
MQRQRGRSVSIRLAWSPDDHLRRIDGSRLDDPAQVAARRPP